MCIKTQFKYCPSAIDECMRKVIEQLSWFDVPTKACCCGHGKYPLTIVVKRENWNHPIELFSGKIIKRKRKFYKTDKQGYYYIPEVCKPLNKSNRRDKK